MNSKDIIADVRRVLLELGPPPPVLYVGEALFRRLSEELGAEQSTAPLPQLGAGIRLDRRLGAWTWIERDHRDDVLRMGDVNLGVVIDMQAARRQRDQLPPFHFGIRTDIA